MAAQIVWQTTVGPCAMRFGTGTKRVDGQTSRQRESTGKALVSTAAIADVNLEIAYIDWDNGDREVRAISVSSPHPVLQRLTSAFRFGIDAVQDDRLTMRIRVPRLRTPEHTTAHQTDVDELTTTTGLNPRRELAALGAIAVGARREILGDRGRMRNELAVVAPRTEAATVLVGAFVLSPVLPSLDLAGFRSANRGPKSAAEEIDEICHHDLPIGTCSICKHDGHPAVYITGGGIRFHSRPDCPALVEGQQQVRARGGREEPIEVVNRGSSRVADRDPCKTCLLT